MPLFKETPLIVCNTACRLPVCLGAAIVEKLGASLGARRSLGFQVYVGESAGLGSAFWGPGRAGLPAAGLRGKERISQSSIKVCYLVNLSLKVCTRGKNFH